jgi:hypothetical protein
MTGTVAIRASACQVSSSRSDSRPARTRAGDRTAVRPCAGRSFRGRSVSRVQGADLSRRRSAASSGLAWRATEVDTALLRVQLRRGHCDRGSRHRDRQHVSLDRYRSHRDLVRPWLRLDHGRDPARRYARRIADAPCALLSVANQPSCQVRNAPQKRASCQRPTLVVIKETAFL